MELYVNGKKYHPEKASNLGELIEEIEGDDKTEGLAIAVNDEVVPRSEWHSHGLEDGKRVEVIRAVQGG